MLIREVKPCNLICIDQLLDRLANMDLDVNETICLIIQNLFGNTSQLNVFMVVWKSIIIRQVSRIAISMKFGRHVKNKDKHIWDKKKVAIGQTCRKTGC